MDLLLPLNALALGLTFSASYCVFVLYVRYQRLAHIPGPFLAAFTDLWRARIQFFGPIVPTLHQLHEKYGPVVRIGPNTVSLSNPAHIPIVGSPRGGFAKADSYGPLRVFLNGKTVGSIIDMQDEELNRSIRRAVGAAFIPKNVLEYEGDVSSTLDALAANIRTHHVGKGPFELYGVMQYFQLDTLFQVAFGDHPGHLTQDSDVYGMAKTLYKRIFHWYAWQPLPRLERFVFQNRLWSDYLTVPSPWAREGARRVAAALSDPSSTLSPPDPSPSSKRLTLLQKYLEASHVRPSSIPPSSLTSLINSTISAGADTTSGGLTSIFYLILRHPRIHARLLAELQAANLSRPIRYSEIHHLPYLDATVREALRFISPLAIPLEVAVPQGGCLLPVTTTTITTTIPEPTPIPKSTTNTNSQTNKKAQKTQLKQKEIQIQTQIHIPQGATLSISPWIIHQSKQIFGPDSSIFRPERYCLDPQSQSQPQTSSPSRSFPSPSQEKITEMERANLVWGLGSRVCLGRHIAELEIKMVLATLLLSFDFKLHDPNLDIAFQNLGTFEMQLTPVTVTASERA